MEPPPVLSSAGSLADLKIWTFCELQLPLVLSVLPLLRCSVARKRPCLHHPRPFKFINVPVWLLLVAHWTPAKAETAISLLADKYVAILLANNPTLADVANLPGPEDSLPDISPKAVIAYASAENRLLSDVSAIDRRNVSVADRPTYAVLKEALHDDLAMGICRQELWSLNHFFGWQVSLPTIALQQPVSDEAFRNAALRRWSALPSFIQQDEANLREGLATGYSAPQSVVRRVIAELDELLQPAPENSSFASPGVRSGDTAFRQKFTDLVRTTINPAIRRYRDFLQDEYLPKARKSFAVSDLPHGKQCYAASLRMFTTLPRGPRDVYTLGKTTVEINDAAVAALGAKLYGTSDLPTIYSRVSAATGNHFASPDEFLAYERSHLARNIAAAKKVFANYPQQEVVVEPVAVDQRETPPAHFEPQSDLTKPGLYVLPLAPWKSTTRGYAEILSVHEAVPGHALQISTAFESAKASKISNLVMNAAYTEGWARYAEGLAEELNLYETNWAKIERRAWPAHGMVVDPGIHVFGWSRERAIRYMMATGEFDKEAAVAMLDRIAVNPGQLTAYDTGGLEILSLRKEAQSKLGSRFNLGQFHKSVLEEGSVPLIELREHVRSWIKATIAAH